MARPANFPRARYARRGRDILLAYADFNSLRKHAGVYAGHSSRE